MKTLLFLVGLLTSTLALANSQRALFIIPPEKFQDVELNTPLKILRDNQIKIDVASTKKGKIVGDLGGTAIATIKIDKINVANYDLIVVIGGSGTVAHLFADLKTQKLVKDAAAAGKWIGGICAGSVVLAKAGLLVGKRATTFPDNSLIEELKKQGANYVSDLSIIDGKIITANGPDGAVAFANNLLKVLAPNPSIKSN